MAQTILRFPLVRARTGLSRSTIYLKVSEGSFPRPISLSARSVGWVESEIDPARPAVRRRGLVSMGNFGPVTSAIDPVPCVPPVVGQPSLKRRR